VKGKATPETFFGKVVKEFGANRIIWGSNFPAAPQELPELIALARNTLSFLPQQDQDWIFFKTAQALYPALAK
jgi:predicted TIM-barrel fold metal-dependent hydrolase